MNKKADVFQIIFMTVILLVLAIVGLICLVLTSGVNDFWDSSGLLNNTAVGLESQQKIENMSYPITDYAILFLFIGMNLGAMVAAVRTNFTPTVIVLFFILTIMAIFIAGGSVNIYQGLAQQDSIIAVSSRLTFTNFLFSKYTPLIINGLCALVVLIMYGKSGGDIVP